MATTAGGTYYAASSELVSSWPATSLDLANQLESRFAAKASTANFPSTWTAYTPAYNFLSPGNAGVSARYLRLGNLMHMQWTFTVGSTTAFYAGQIGVELPRAAASTAGATLLGQFYDLSAGTTYSTRATISGSASHALLIVTNTASTYGTFAALTNTVPAAPASGDVFWLYGSYECAP